ncbi:hypothetical protein [Streptomyces noursei]|uniref:hypothetical protein n=1 Tax=Streptomyces noursei TaxID=1971 RepID=UPI0011AF36D4|nr:hypothetical protein [Streptomyces noursei]
MDHKVDYEVLVHLLGPTYGSAPTQPLTGEEANIMIRRLVVNSMADETWHYEVPDRNGRPLRIVARTQRTEDGGLSGPRVVREVYEQAVTGKPVEPLDWLERWEYKPPKSSRQPVKVGDRVTAMTDGFRLAAGLATAIEWKLHPMQAHYALPPLWSWEWRVTVWFGGDQEREGAWKDHWVGKASNSLPDTQKFFEPIWQKLEAEFPERQAAE